MLYALLTVTSFLLDLPSDILENEYLGERIKHKNILLLCTTEIIVRIPATFQ